MDDKTQQALAKLPDILKKDLNQNLCMCNEVPKIDVIRAIAAGADTREKVQQITYASDGNGCCRRQVARLIECIHEDRC
ncbi:(2Fe-2S)-binding protein [Thiomicrospira sp. WB1]|uniref:(2Fe-2S)-binding protein n=1 Tax=Thiomicrospira sp. WB1 TaxID=1685380 RepID=UPI00074855C9|nr:(2Fe-2S)-binding protein [Thiomicrospira sp. WB1]KUJ71990.1 (2Fe-2S)-binding protein [Thiomicrospira sp. WB1]